LRMKRNKIERRAGLARGMVLSAEAVLEEFAREAAAAAGRIGPADAGRRQRPANGGDGIIVQLMKFLGRAAPVTDVRLVPNLPVPRFDLLAAVTLDAMPHPLLDQLAPL